MNKLYLSQGQKLLPGIYGGMGPASHLKFEDYLIKGAHDIGLKREQDIPVWILLNGSSTPDRTDSILKRGEDSSAHLVYFSQRLELAGCDFIVITCNTAHHYLDTIRKHISIPIVSMIDETVKEIQNKWSGVKRVGILATSGILKSKIYETALKKVGIELIYPKINSKTQKKVMDAIYNLNYGIKANSKIDSKALEYISYAANQSKVRGAEILISGCTEISLAFEKIQAELPIVDPLKTTAYKTIALASGVESLDFFENKTANRFDKTFLS